MFDVTWQWALFAYGIIVLALLMVWAVLGRFSEKTQLHYLRRAYRADLTSFVADFLRNGELNASLNERWVSHLRLLSGFPFRWFFGIRRSLRDAHASVENDFDQEVEIEPDWKNPVWSRIKLRPWRFVMLGHDGEQIGEVDNIERFSVGEATVIRRVFLEYQSAATLLVLHPQGRIVGIRERSEILSPSGARDN